MPNFNKVYLMGNITRDIELKHTPNGHAVAKIGLAVNRKWKAQDGSLQEEVTFVDCDAWGRTAEVMNQYLAKGRPVFIEGRLRLDTWQDKDGSNRSKLKVVIESFEFIDSKGGGGGGGDYQGGQGGYANAPAGAAAAATGGRHEPISEDDIPF